MPGPLIGILGGMGPLATADFMAQLTRLTPAARDQDHCRSLVYSNPRIPDRSQAILSQGPSPLPYLLDGLAMLGRCGAHVIAIPCNSAHVWLDELTCATDIPIIGIVDAVAQDLRRQGIMEGRVGVLGTLGLVRSGLYQAGLRPFGFDVLIPTETELSTLVEPSIRAIKAGQIAIAEAPIRRAIKALEARDVAAVILGCTELVLAMPAAVSDRGAPLIDSTKALALACIRWVAAYRPANVSGPVMIVDG